MDIEALQSTTLFVFLQDNHDWALPLIALIACAESFALVGVALPGVLLLGAAALFGSLIGIPLWQLLIATWVGAVIGDSVSFAIGVYARSHMQARRRERELRWLSQCEPLFVRYGWVALAGGRFIGPLRPIMPLVAGLLGMDAKRFIALNLATGVPWCMLYTVPGYWLGQSVAAGLALHWLLIALAALAALGGALYWWRRHFLELAGIRPARRTSG